MQIKFNSSQIDVIVDYIIDGYKREKNVSEDLKRIIKNFCIFNESKDNSSNTSLSNATHDYLLPDEEENNSIPIITRSNVKFWDTKHPKNIQFILEDILGITKLNQKMYWLEHVFPYLDGITPIDKVNQVILSIFNRWESLICSNVEIMNQLKNVKIIKVNNTGHFENDYRKACEIYTKCGQQNFTNLFFKDEIIFPIDNPSIQNYHGKMELLGAKNILTANDLIDRIQLYLEKMDQHDKQLNKKPLFLLKFIDEHFTNINNCDNGNQLFDLIRNEKWMLASGPEKNVSSTTTSYQRPSECYDKKYEQLVSHVIPIVDHEVKNQDLRMILGWDKPPSIDLVIDELLIIIEEYQCNSEFYKKRQIEKNINDIYGHFNNIIKASPEGCEIETLKEKLNDEI